MECTLMKLSYAHNVALKLSLISLSMLILKPLFLFHSVNFCWLLSYCVFVTTLDKGLGFTFRECVIHISAS